MIEIDIYKLNEETSAFDLWLECELPGVPSKDELININDKIYMVVQVSWNTDSSLVNVYVKNTSLNGLSFSF